MQVLAEAGPAGMRVEEIARRIQKAGLRDLRTSRWGLGHSFTLTLPPQCLFLKSAADGMLCAVGQQPFGLRQTLSHCSRLLHATSYSPDSQLPTLPILWLQDARGFCGGRAGP